MLAHMSAGSGGGYGRETAIVDEVVVSRAGHFTCPCLAGALLLGQASATPVPAEASHSSPRCVRQQPGCTAPGGSGAVDGADVGPLWSDHATSAARLVAMPLDPMCAALARCTSAAAVRAAIAAGTLPPLLAHTVAAGAEWVEFAPLPRAARAARRAAGWAANPVLWWRFAPRGELAPHEVQAGAAALQLLAPGDEGDVVMLDAGGEPGDGEADLEGEEAGGEAGAGPAAGEVAAGGAAPAGTAPVNGADSDAASALAPMIEGDGVAGGSDAAYTDARSSEGGNEEAVAGGVAAGPSGTGAAAPSAGAASSAHAQPEPQPQPQPQGHQQPQLPSPAKRHGCAGSALTGAPTATRAAGAATEATPVRLDSAAGFTVLPAPALGELPHRGPPALVLRMRLRARRTGNTAIVRLINPVGRAGGMDRACSGDGCWVWRWARR